MACILLWSSAVRYAASATDTGKIFQTRIVRWGGGGDCIHSSLSLWKSGGILYSGLVWFWSVQGNDIVQGNVNEADNLVENYLLTFESSGLQRFSLLFCPRGLIFTWWGSYGLCLT